MKRVLMSSTPNFSKKKAAKYEQLLYQKLGNINLYSSIDKNDQDIWEFNFTVSQAPEECTMVASRVSKKDAEKIKEYIKELTTPKEFHQEGFHIIEHILLRPNDKEDEIMNKSDFLADNVELIDPYSFWLSVILPGWMGRFSDLAFRKHFEQVFLMETPAHIAVCFRWVTNEALEEVTSLSAEEWFKQFEHRLEEWKEELAKCTPDECNLTAKANALIDSLRGIKCDCADISLEAGLKCEEKPKPVAS